MASSIAGPIIGPSPAVELAPAAAGCVSRVADGPAGVPEGWPKFLDEPMAWVGPQFTDESEYIHTLSESDLQEAENALLVFKALGLDGDCVSRDNFPLPTLGPRLDRIRRDVHQGKGFGVICGLDPQKYLVEDLTVLYLGIQSYIANRHGRQDRTGNMLVHIVADNSSKLKAGHHRHSTSPITFHNEEAGDIVSWLTRSTAVSGGKCIIASAYTVYNVLATSCSDMVRTLARSDWPFALPRFQCRPVLFHHEGRVLINFGRVALTGNAIYPRPTNLPAVTPRQMEALDSIENIAKATQLEISTRAGDMHFINNLTILHRREGFINGEAAQERRHLVRMRLRDDEMGWKLPADLRQEWSAAFNEEAPKIWHIEPMPDGFFPLRSSKLKSIFYFRANQSNSTGSSRYYTLGFLVLFIVSAMASAIDTGLTTATSLNSLLPTTSTFTLENSLPGCSWPKTLQDAQDPLSNMMSASVTLDIGPGPLLFENGNFELLVGIISLCSKDGWGRNLSQSNYQAKLQTKPTGDNPWAPRIDTVVALLSLMVAVLGLVPAYFNAFLAWVSHTS
ncbi:hypothetical protein BFJ71_g15508 [Fusarium oxysporum]|nr:hypothetical protein BFJ71_g15508 [Fusarium oxysporum]